MTGIKDQLSKPAERQVSLTNYKNIYLKKNMLGAT